MINRASHKCRVSTRNENCWFFGGGGGGGVDVVVVVVVVVVVGSGSFSEV